MAVRLPRRRRLRTFPVPRQSILVRDMPPLRRTFTRLA